MDGGGDAFAVAANPWSLVRGYFSPATLFLLLNMVIGTIALTSRSRRRHIGEDHDHHYQYQQHCGDLHQYAPPPPPAPLARTSSIMERLRSLGLYRFRSGDFPPEYNHHLPAGADDDSTRGGAREAQAQYARSRSEPAARPPPPRVRRATDRNEEAAEAVVGAAMTTKSSSEVKKLERAPAQAQTLQVRRAPRAAPARRAQLAVREEEDAAAAVSVDARADDFINKFRQQLQLQRLNSLLNYKEMLNRGL
ncbi:uncharacterized protein C2845_PM07G20610 [Panicum miliaceum]|uniref:DUF4408 domain-containing protein n=1 Tax=Panicum miliaceum TaxID=4540 RepID=A0A3L6SVB3_PANMI|nr:uncharacterized protein C2845_PM07G20610 [Panicum miliaceum]